MSKILEKYYCEVNRDFMYLVLDTTSKQQKWRTETSLLEEQPELILKYTDTQDNLGFFS